MEAGSYKLFMSKTLWKLSLFDLINNYFENLIFKNQMRILVTITKKQYKYEVHCLPTNQDSLEGMLLKKVKWAYHLK